MKVSVKWLRNYVEIDSPIAEICDKLTMAGLEVAEIKEVGGWKNVVVGQIVGINPHPNADRLRLATVDIGGQQKTVVCGAPNLTIGDKIAFASVGAVLIDGHSGKTEVLKPAKIRGVSSEGMVCSEKELGISDNHEGILVLLADAPVGTPLAEYLGDTVIDVEVTPNRPDCMSVIGIAREIAAQTEKKVHINEIKFLETGEKIDSFIKVEIASPALCPRYCASLLTDVKLGPSPDWMQQRLISSGMRPINNVVDITNFVMLEYGQPLHAFDYANISDKKIVVRRARNGEIMKTLDGVERTLSDSLLLIADGRRAVAIAGIMGGEGSEVTESTSSVLIESANFNQAVIHKGSTELKLASEASLRFEKGLSLELPIEALKRATQLMQEITGAKVISGFIDEYPGFKEKRPILLLTSEIKRLLGLDISLDKIIRSLDLLGFECHQTDLPNRINVDVPWWRTDVTRAADLIEEVARIVGYDNLPSTTLSTPIPEGQSNPILKFRQNLKEIMVGCGFQEVVNYSLTSREWIQKTMTSGEVSETMVSRLMHPMSRELECMRTDLRDGILKTLSRNQHRQQKNIRIFELGKTFGPGGGKLPDEKNMLCAALCSDTEEQFWRDKEAKPDLYIIKGVVETLMIRSGLKASFSSGDDRSLLQEKTANILIGSEFIGVFGEVHPMVLKAFDITDSVFLVELDINKMSQFLRSTYSFTTIPKYPGVTRDIALVVDDRITYRQLHDTIEVFPLVKNVRLFDLYKGDQVPAGKKSIAIRIDYLSEDHTLTDLETEKVQKNIIEKLAADFGSTLRV